MRGYHFCPLGRGLVKTIRLTSFSALAITIAMTIAITGCKHKLGAAPDDASLTQAVQSKLSSDTAISTEPIQASVLEGVATLDGPVSSAAARSLAVNDVSQVAGVKRVVNNLVVQPPAVLPVPVVATAEPVEAPVVRTQPAPSTKPERPVGQRKPSAAIAPLNGVSRSPNRRTAQEADATPAAQIERVEPAHTPPPPPVARFRSITLPADTTLAVRITQTLDSATTQTGDAFSGVLASDIVSDGVTVLPQGTPVSGKVDVVHEAAHFKGSSMLTIELTSLDRRGDHLPITTDTFSKSGKGRGRNSGEKIGGGAAVGAILGGILGGGKGAAIGAAAGGGAGAGVQAITKGQQVQIESESLVSFHLSNPVTVRVSNKEDAGNAREAGDLQRHN